MGLGMAVREGRGRARGGGGDLLGAGFGKGGLGGGHIRLWTVPEIAPPHPPYPPLGTWG